MLATFVCAWCLSVVHTAEHGTEAHDHGGATCLVGVWHDDVSHTPAIAPDGATSRPSVAYTPSTGWRTAPLSLPTQTLHPPPTGPPLA